MARTVASMNLRLPDGRSFPYECDFGEDYPEESARFMFFEGNYACDCNKMLFLAREYPEVFGSEDDDLTPCGDTITIDGFLVRIVED